MRATYVNDPRAISSLTEVNDMNDVLTFSEPNEKVIRLDIAVDEALRVHVLQSAQQLPSGIIISHTRGTHADDAMRQQCHAMGRFSAKTCRVRGPTMPRGYNEQMQAGTWAMQVSDNMRGPRIFVRTINKRAKPHGKEFELSFSTLLSL